MHRLLILWLCCFLLATLPSYAQLLAVIDKSRPEDAGLSQSKLNLLAQVVRGEAAKRLNPQGFTVLSEENTVTILRDMGVNLADCSGDCEVETARKLQADWLLSSQLIRFGKAWTLQLNLFETASGALRGSERAQADSEDELLALAEDRSGLLCVQVSAGSGAAVSARLGETPDAWGFENQLGVLIAFESRPPGATVTLDGSYLGETPLSKELLQGPHRLEWALPRHETHQEAVQITKKETLTRSLTPLFGWLTVESTPGNQHVTLDGAVIGNTPLTEFVAGHGPHSILVGDSALVYPQGERFSLGKGERKLLKYEIPIREGGLVIRCEDDKGNAVEVPVSIDGKAMGTSPLQLKLPIGEHEVLASGARQTVEMAEKVVKTITLTVDPSSFTPIIQSVPGNLPGMNFVTIPAGIYTIGSPKSESGRDDDESQHEVRLFTYAMMTTEVTQAQWFAVMGSNPSRFKGDDLPVETVTWNDVQTFLSRLNRLYPGKNYRLPTEAEWEVACRAGATARFVNGESKANLDEIAWYSANSKRKTHPVAQKRPNAWGLYDMHGNVWEWCQDWYGSYESGTQIDPVGQTLGSYRVYRGGSWSSVADYLRCANRYSDGPNYSSNYLGLRLSRTP